MRIVYKNEERDTVYRINKAGNNYYISEQNGDIGVPAYVFYFIVSVITFLSGILSFIFIYTDKNLPLKEYSLLIEMFIYSIEFIIFGILNKKNFDLFSNPASTLLFTSTIICQIITRLIIKIFG